MYIYIYICVYVRVSVCVCVYMYVFYHSGRNNLACFNYQLLTLQNLYDELLFHDIYLACFKTSKIITAGYSENSLGC